MFEAAPNPVDVAYHNSLVEPPVGRHFHNAHEIILVTEGRVRYQINHSFYEVEKNSLLFISNLEIHELQILEHPYKRYFILINPDYFQSLVGNPLLTALFKHRPGNFKHSLPLSNEEFDFFMNLFQTMGNETSQKKELWQNAVGALINQFLITLYRSHTDFFPATMSDGAAQKILEIQHYIEAHYSEEISLSALSRQFYADSCYISHLFKKITGFTFKEYLILYRLSKAKELLIQTGMDVTRVGLESGFSNVSHFIRMFKKHENETPYQYRKKLANHPISRPVKAFNQI